MSAVDNFTGALQDSIPFIAITILWLVIIAVVYSVFMLAWPDIPGAEPWIYLGVYLIPVIGFIGHTLQQALKAS